MEEIRIEYVPIGSIRPYENNPRKNDEAVPAVMKSISEFGFKGAIIVDSDGVIIAGHTRYKAAVEMEAQEVPIIRASDLNEDQVRAFRLADNKVQEFSTWDHALLSVEQSEIEDQFDLSAFGFELPGDKPDGKERPAAAKIEEYVTCPRCGKQIKRWRSESNE